MKHILRAHASFRVYITILLNQARILKLRKLLFKTIRSWDE